MTEKGKVTRVLFVCLGNICRSPAAEGIMRQMAEEHGMGHRFFIDSAGIGSWHVGQLPDRRMRRHGERHGYRFESRARQFSMADFARFDLIVGMDEENVADLMAMARTEDDAKKIRCMKDYLVNHPHLRSVPDPYYGGDRDFELVIELLEDGCAELIRKEGAPEGGVRTHPSPPKGRE
ncbi:MAG: low molecular weight phosphotyrosine protein phosphatase [Prevotella sp.]|nr:low molecular weight phosphotyrosine protein phosphatase [Prevotella sp.]